MKKFYDDEMLGIQQEDAPQNSVAGGGVSLPADAVSKKKQKEIQKDPMMVGQKNPVRL